MRAYKLMRQRKNGTLGSLFINARAVIPMKQWLNAEFYPTHGFAPRKGWHCTFYPYAPHLGTKGRVWVEVEVEDISTFDRPECQGGSWILAGKMFIIKLLSNEEIAVLNSKRQITSSKVFKDKL